MATAKADNGLSKVGELRLVRHRRAKTGVASAELRMVRGLLFILVSGIPAIVAAVFTTVLDLPIVWRTTWLTICILCFVSLISGIVLLCGHLGQPTSIE